ncbi:MAG: hypothetical protein QOE03_1308 [Micromonosporaceae bacterium]|nr:hypothetical protein [Micromonosporaceae bacterium]
MRRSLYLIIASAALASSVAACTKPPATPAAGGGKPAPSPSTTAASAAGSTTSTPSAEPSGGTSGGGGVATGAGAVQRPDRCHTANLHLSFTSLVPAGQAGSEHDARLGLTNAGDRSCVIYGYPGIQLIGADGKPRPTIVRRGTGAPQRVTLKPGTTAWSMIEWRDTPLADEENTAPLCGARMTHLKVIAPDESTQLAVVAAIGTVCSHGEIWADAFQATRPTIG